MAKRPGTLPLVGLSEVAQLAGVTKSAVANWYKRHGDFPRPVAELACGPIWLEAEVREWLTSTGRKTQGRRM